MPERPTEADAPFYTRAHAAELLTSAGLIHNAGSEPLERIAAALNKALCAGWDMHRDYSRAYGSNPVLPKPDQPLGNITRLPEPGQGPY